MSHALLQNLSPAVPVYYSLALTAFACRYNSCVTCLPHMIQELAPACQLQGCLLMWLSKDLETYNLVSQSLIQLQQSEMK